MRSSATDLLVTGCVHDEPWPEDAFLLSSGFYFRVLEKFAIHVARNVIITSY